MRERFGGRHANDNDSAASLSNMTVLSDHPDSYEPDRFHLVGVGVYTQLSTYRSIYFCGRLEHGGTAPMAPAGEEPVSWAVCCVVVFYPAGVYVNGVGRQAIAALPYKQEPLYLSPEMIGIK